jgi:hypothetical protein
MTYRDMLETDLVSPKALYRYYLSYKYLYEYWEEHRKEHPVSNDEMRSRINYILKNKVRQRDEISTLCWILGEEDVREKDKY